MQTGWQKISGNWYHFTSGGVMQTGWQKFGSRWYYFAPDGAMATGWKKIGSSWYHFTSGGAMQTGWQKISGSWYHFTSGGVMQTGWQKFSSSWYYFAPDGVMATGWKKIGSNWYHFTSGGAMQTGWQQIGSDWYYLNSSGIMQTGWLFLGKNWYYMNNSGVMQTGKTVINKITYTFKKNGALSSNGASLMAESYLAILSPVAVVNRTLESKLSSDYNIVLHDLFGDSNPELVYFTVAEQSGSTGGMVQFPYTHVVTAHIVTFDVTGNKAVELASEICCYYNEADYSAIYNVSIADYFVLSGSDRLYRYEMHNLSGNFHRYQELTYNMETKSLDETFDTGTIEWTDDKNIKNANIRKAATGAVTKLSLYGRRGSDCSNYTYSQAVSYLNQYTK